MIRSHSDPAQSALGALEALGPSGPAAAAEAVALPPAKDGELAEPVCKPMGLGECSLRRRQWTEGRGRETTNEGKVGGKYGGGR